MNMRIAILTLACIGSGCASYSERQAHEPWAVVETTKTPDDYVRCIAPLVRDLWPGITVAPDGDATVIALPASSAGAVLATITVEPQSDGSRAAYRSASRIGNFRKVEAHLQTCK